MQQHALGRDTSTNCEVDFDGGDEADGENGDEYVADDAVVVESQFHAAGDFLMTMSVQYSRRQQHASRHTYTVKSVKILDGCRTYKAFR